MSRTDLAHPAVDAVLSTAATLLGMEVVFIGGLTADTYTFERMQDRTGGDWVELPPEGTTIGRTDSLCHRMLSGARPATSDAEADPCYADAPSRLCYGITSYVGIPVHDASGTVVATLCGLDRDHVEVKEETLEVLRQLTGVVAAFLCAGDNDGVVIRRAPQGGWAVGAATTGDLTSAMVLADLLAAELDVGARPPRSEEPTDEVSRLRLSVQQLEHALAARVVVEQAIGVLTERQRSTPRDAFERLRKVARSRGRKVHDLAKEVVQSATESSVPLPPELAGPR